MIRPVVIAILTVSLSGCADFEGPTGSGGLPDVIVAAPQFQRDVYPMIELRCGIGGCHSEAIHQGGLYLTRDSAYAALVGRASRLYLGEVFVRPGDAANSWLVIAIGDDDTRRHGMARMPLASGPLTPNQIQTIVNWINRGAPND